VPILFVDRREGSSKINFREVYGGMATILRLLFTPEGRKTARGGLEHAGTCHAEA